MKYKEITFVISPKNDIVSEILPTLTSEAGLESFIETENGLKGYAQINNFNETILKQVIENFPLDNICINYEICNAEDKNWNETWEKNCFKPINIANKILVHNGKDEINADSEYTILINPKQAFGTGGHNTTKMLLERMINMDLKNKSVIDAGCGTGILGIFAAMKGANNILCYDIDNWSIENTKENIKLNDINCITVKEGDATVLNNINIKYDLIIANINRNILINDMPTFKSALHSGSHLLISGFYKSDIEKLKEKAFSLGFEYIDTTEEDDWATLLFILK